MRDSFEPLQACSLHFRLFLANRFPDFSWQYPSVSMLRQRLWIPYEGTAREDTATPLRWPVWFRCRNMAHFPPTVPVGINITEGVRGRFNLIPEDDEDLPLGRLFSCKVHIWVESISQVLLVMVADVDASAHWSTGSHDEADPAPERR